MNDKIEIQYHNKTYEIEKDPKEQKVRPKGVVYTQGDPEIEDNKEITVKNYQEGFWNTSVEVEGSKIELHWGKGKYLTVYGTPATVLAIIAGVIYYYRQYSKKPLPDLLGEIKDKVTEKQVKEEAQAKE